jgi:hypothetical protein
MRKAAESSKPDERAKDNRFGGFNPSPPKTTAELFSRDRSVFFFQSAGIE